MNVDQLKKISPVFKFYEIQNLGTCKITIYNKIILDFCYNLKLLVVDT